MMGFTVPKYYQVKKAIVEKINNEEFRIGEMIPSERELIAMFDVSRITVRKAVEELAQEGYLVKVQGKGTFVKDDSRGQSLFSLTSCTQDIIRLGMVPTRKVLSAEVIPADKARLRVLNLFPGDEVFKLQRIYCADGEPINYTTTYLPYKLFKNIEKNDFSRVSLYETIEKAYGVRIVHAKRTIEAVLAHDEIREYLHVDDGIPLLLFRCTTWGILNDRELPIETFKCFYRSDQFRFYIDQVK
ncbi:MAG: GntR family transcriptional regulator [Spirochaetaceae bacterium]|jgi:GntR family transcriptional regulator|nr:GntR family transcriptional regulator [Spirochaetaceae bacterium]